MHLQTLFLYVFNYLLKISALMFRWSFKYLYFIGDPSSSKLAPFSSLVHLGQWYLTSSGQIPSNHTSYLPSFLRYLSLSLLLHFMIDPSAATVELSLNYILNLTSHELHESFLVQAASITYCLNNSNRLLLDLPASYSCPI